MRELQRILGKKTMENEILHKTISRVAGPKKTPLRTLSLPEGDLGAWSQLLWRSRVSTCPHPGVRLVRGSVDGLRYRTRALWAVSER